jgi:hydroxymethylglutaryl-CoA lyase
MTHTTQRVEITEVGMRDGFQMEQAIIPTRTKVEIGRALIAAGLSRIEATSFVSPRAVPQLSDATEVIEELKGHGARLAALVPNLRGAERAAAAGADEMVVFVSASETHNRLNINSSVIDSLAKVGEIAMLARSAGTELCGAVATSFGCPFEGDISPDAVTRVVESYASAGVHHVTLGDTTGMATPPLVDRLCRVLLKRFPEVTFSLHFHNTRGLGLVNVRAGLEAGVNHYESSIGGLGGCPFATGATGNICTEDLVYMMDETGITTGIDLEAISDVAHRLEAVLGRTLPGQLMKAGPRLKLHQVDETRIATG